MDKEYLDLCENAAYTKKRELEHKYRVAHAKQVLSDFQTIAQAAAVEAGEVKGANAEIRKNQLDTVLISDKPCMEARRQLEKEERELIDATAESVFAEAKLSITKAWLYSQARIT
jgi:hypothetical protein